MAERLFDHDPAPLARFLVDQARGSKTGYRDAEEPVGDREIEEIIAGCAHLLVQPGDISPG